MASAGYAPVGLSNEQYENLLYVPSCLFLPVYTTSIGV